MFDQYVLGVDVSHWQPVVDWELLAENGVAFAWMKAAQGSYAQDPSLAWHLKGAKTAGLLCGFYHWVDPNNPAADQLENLKHAVGENEFSFLALDVEQYWVDWLEWQRREVTRFIPGKQISERAQTLAGLAADWCRLPVLIYTRASFVTEYAPQMESWLGEWPLWLAHYPYANGRVSLSWQTLKTHYAPSIQAPALPRGGSDWRFWQFSGDKFLLPGCQTALDLDFFHGSRQELFAWLNQPVPPLTVSLEEKVRRLWEGHPELWMEENYAA